MSNCIQVFGIDLDASYWNAWFWKLWNMQLIHTIEQTLKPSILQSTKEDALMIIAEVYLHTSRWCFFIIYRISLGSSRINVNHWIIMCRWWKLELVFVINPPRVQHSVKLQNGKITKQRCMKFYQKAVFDTLILIVFWEIPNIPILSLPHRLRVFDVVVFFLVH